MGPDAHGEALSVARDIRIDESTLSKLGLETLWFNPAPVRENPVSGAYLLDSGLYVATQPVRGSGARLKKLSRSDGITTWYYDLDGLVAAPPTEYDGSQPEVYLVVNDTVHCLGRHHGDLLWKRPTAFTISTSVIANDQRFFAGSENGRMYGVLKNQSIDDWTYLTGDYIEAHPVMDRSGVYIASTDGSIYKLSPVGGFRQGFSWKFATGARITATPVVFSNWVLVGSTDYKLYCLDATDGSLVWSFLAEAPVLDPPVVYSVRPGQETVYCIATKQRREGDTRTLFAVKLRGGQTRWRVEGIRKVVSIGSNNLYALTDAASRRSGGRALVALDVMTGEERFRIRVDRGLRFVPTNEADYGRNQRERGRIYLVGAHGAVQAIAEK